MSDLRMDRIEAVLSSVVETVTNQTQAIRALGRQVAQVRDKLDEELAALLAIATVKPKKPNGEATGKFKLIGAEEIEVTDAAQRKIGAVAINAGIVVAKGLAAAALGWLAYHLGLHPR